MPRSRSFTRFTIRVALPHLGQSVLLVVSITFLRSAVFAILAPTAMVDFSWSLQCLRSASALFCPRRLWREYPENSKSTQEDCEAASRLSSVSSRFYSMVVPAVSTARGSRRRSYWRHHGPLTPLHRPCYRHMFALQH